MKILIADNHFLSRIGLEHFVQNFFQRAKYISVLVEGYKALSDKIKKHSPDIVIMDYISTKITADELNKLQIKYPEIKFVLITEWMPKREWKKYFQVGIKWHLLKECDADEIKECIEYASNNQAFFCNKLVQFINSSTEELSVNERTSMNCNGVIITQREREIIRLIAEGLSNKQIAHKLNLSIHTVLTHRKNIMKKTSANNTAGLVLFALKHQIITSNNHYLFADYA